MVKTRSGKAKESSQVVFFPLWKLVKAMVEKIENLKPAHSVRISEGGQLRDMNGEISRG
jgi:hypothetical protein